jgi:hypothetical protein
MRLQSVSDDTLFFVFYGMPGDLAQLAAAVILCVTILAFPLSKHGRVSLFLVAVVVAVERVVLVLVLVLAFSVGVGVGRGQFRMSKNLWSVECETSRLERRKSIHTHTHACTHLPTHPHTHSLMVAHTHAHERYERHWRYHKEQKVWITRAPGVEPSQKTSTYERGTYIYFDHMQWKKVRNTS